MDRSARENSNDSMTIMTVGVLDRSDLSFWKHRPELQIIRSRVDESGPYTFVPMYANLIVLPIRVTLFAVNRVLFALGIVNVVLQSLSPFRKHIHDNIMSGTFLIY